MSTLAPTSAPSAVRRLRQFLDLDAVVTGVNGLAYVLLAGPLETLLGAPADLLRLIGAFLIAYGIAVGIAARRATPARAAARTIIVANLVWVAASLSVLAVGALSPTLIGSLWIAAQALVVAGFAAAQGWALRGWTA
ncbi:MAG: hypothetical protein M3400_17230 [Actinomycetota bacterium]|nr:hypothetical protein [Actinomycetota bacterium]